MLATSHLPNEGHGVLHVAIWMKVIDKITIVDNMFLRNWIFPRNWCAIEKARQVHHTATDLLPLEK